LPYRLHRLNLYKGEQNTPEFRKINPAGLIPAIVDPDGPGGKPFALSQSGAIVVYCAEKSGKFLPKDAATRAIAMQWFVQASSDISGASMTVFRLENTAPEKSVANVDYFKKRTSTTSRKDCLILSLPAIRRLRARIISRANCPSPT